MGLTTNPDRMRAVGRNRGVAQSGSAPHWGCGGRRFKSCRPDQFSVSGRIVAVAESRRGTSCRPDPFSASSCLVAVAGSRRVKSCRLGAVFCRSSFQLDSLSGDPLTKLPSRHENVRHHFQPLASVEVRLKTSCFQQSKISSRLGLSTAVDGTHR